MTNTQEVLTEIRLSAAMRAPEDGIAPSRRRTSSLNAQVADLDVGGVASKVVQIGDNIPLGVIAESATLWREELRNSCTPSVRSAMRSTGGTYSIEVEELVTKKGRFYLVALITRTE